MHFEYSHCLTVVQM